MNDKSTKLKKKTRTYKRNLYLIAKLIERKFYLNLID